MAQPKTLTLTLPTTNTDGTAITSGELVDVDVGYGTTSGVYSTIVEEAMTTVDPANTPLVSFAWSALNQPTLVPATYYFAARMKSNAGIVSAWSNEAQFIVVPPTPSAPTLFTIA